MSANLSAEEEKTADLLRTILEKLAAAALGCCLQILGCGLLAAMVFSAFLALLAKWVIS